MDLSIVRDREKLRPNKKAEPCWQRIRPGCYVGFVSSAKGGQGTWVARAYDEEKRRYRRKALGAFPELAGDKKFTAAKAEAERFADRISSGGHLEEKIETVADACRAFAKGRPEDEARFRRYVDSDPIAKVKLEKLRRHHLKAWRERLEAAPALVSRNKSGDRRTRERSPATINRDMAALRAALGARLAQGEPGTEAAWQEALRPVKNATRRRDLYLSRDQRKKLLDHSKAEGAPFIRALCLLPLRPGAIAALSVRDFDKRTSELTIGKDKSGKDRRILVPAGVARLLEEQSKNKLPAAPIFMRASGERWNKDTWKHPISAAVTAAGLPAEATAYTLRHSTITDLVREGLPLLTIAQISGTSAEMIEKHYGHLARDAAVRALEALTL
jgi:integrase